MGLSAEELAYLTPDERAAYATRLRQELALTSPMEYGVYCSNMERYAHVEYVDNLLMGAQRGHLYKTGLGPRCVWSDAVEAWVHPETGERAIFNIALSEPPRHGKSYHISEHAPAWFRTKYPDLNVHLASYEAKFAASWGGKARDLVEQHPEFKVSVRPDARSASRWEVVGHRGEMKTAGAGGAITGSGRHFGVIDDLIKNSEEALSAVVRESNIDWYISTWKTRREPHPARLRDLQISEGVEPTHPDIFCVDVSMSTRWHEDDLNGWLKRNEPDEWYFVNLPALAFEAETTEDYGDPGRCVLGRKPGEPLCETRYNRTALLEVRASERGLFWFNALYQGVPRVEEGGVLSRPFSYYRTRLTPSGGLEYLLDGGESTHEYRCIRFATLDLAATTKTRSDYTVFAVWDVTPAPNRKLLLRALYRLKIESADHVSYLLRWVHDWSPRYTLIEDRTFGTTLLQQMRRDHPKVPVRPFATDTDKFTRALPLGMKILSKDVFFPADAPWLAEYENELLTFPNGAHDDQVDVSAMAAIEFDKIPKRVKSEWEAPVTAEEKAKAYEDRLWAKKEKSRRRRVASLRRR